MKAEDVTRREIIRHNFL